MEGEWKVSHRQLGLFCFPSLCFFYFIAIESVTRLGVSFASSDYISISFSICGKLTKSANFRLRTQFRTFVPFSFWRSISSIKRVKEKHIQGFNSGLMKMKDGAKWKRRGLYPRHFESVFRFTLSFDLPFKLPRDLSENSCVPTYDISWGSTRERCSLVGCIAVQARPCISTTTHTYVFAYTSIQFTTPRWSHIGWLWNSVPSIIHGMCSTSTISPFPGFE